MILLVELEVGIAFLILALSSADRSVRLPILPEYAYRTVQVELEVYRRGCKEESRMKIEIGSSEDEGAMTHQTAQWQCGTSSPSPSEQLRLTIWPTDPARVLEYDTRLRLLIGGDCQTQR